jgi:hypothetical protein
VFIKVGLFPLIVDRDQWVRYVEALEKADDEDLRPLVALFVEAQRAVLIQASDVAYEVQPISSAIEAIAAARYRLLQRGILPLKGWHAATETADRLREYAGRRLRAISDRLAREIGSLGKGFSFPVIAGTHAGSSDQRTKIVQEPDESADFNEYKATLQLALNAGREDSLMVTFQATGPRFRGIIGVLAYLSIQGVEPIQIGSSFQINYEEEFAHAQSRFSPWLEGTIVEALNQWRRTL